jgi:predicted Fe-Mo cluster-binding NifX family protein
MRIVFPTKENLSYISHTVSLDEADYLTVLRVTGQNIKDVEIVKNRHYRNKKECVEDFKENMYDVVVAPHTENLPIDDLKNIGVSIYEDSVENHLVLESFSDFCQAKLQRQ